MFSSLLSDSGATYRIFVRPSLMSVFTSSIAARVSDELRKCAMLSLSANRRIASTWFFMRAMSGDMTMAVPSMMRAGSW